jgi:hypothetical protein
MNPDRVVMTEEVTDWVIEQYSRVKGKIPKDVGRGVRRLWGEGFIQKLGRDRYRYSVDQLQDNKPLEFSESVKREILKRDGYKCVFCGVGESDGATLCVDHIRPISMGGSNSVANGQALCYEHNTLKNNYSQYEAGKRFYQKMNDDAKRLGDDKMLKFCEGIFKVHEKHEICGITELSVSGPQRGNLESFFKKK